MLEEGLLMAVDPDLRRKAEELEERVVKLRDSL
jgi:hypothetical protein